MAGVPALAVVIAVTAAIDALPVMLAAVLGLAVLAAAFARPDTLLYLYCAAIPFNFALPPGPAGTIARIVGVVFFVGYLVRQPRTLRLGAVPIAGWLFVGWSFVTLFWALDSGTAVTAWVSLAQLFGVTVLVASIVSRRPETARAAIWSYAISATVTAAIAVVAYLEGTGIFSRATAFADQDPALFSSIVLPAAVILFGTAQEVGTRALMRLLAVAMLTICVIALLLSGTRSAWLGLLVAVAVSVVTRRDWRQALALATSAGVALIAVAAIPGVELFLQGRLASSVASGGSGRIDIWAVGLSILASAPLLGVGIGNFSQAFTPYAISQAVASNSSGALFASRGAHNIYLGTSVETGLLGGLLLVLLLLAAFNRRLRTPTATIVQLAVLSLVVQAAFLDILGQKQVWLFLALAFGLAAVPALQRNPAVQAAGSAAGPVADAKTGHPVTGLRLAG